MDLQDSGDSGRAVKAIFRAAKSLQTTLSQMRDKHPDLSKIEVRVTETRENKYEDTTGTSTSARQLVFIIIAETAEHAFEHAKDLEDQGCVCTSSGETEVTCTCLDTD